jgi:hypothetical protein
MSTAQRAGGGVTEVTVVPAGLVGVELEAPLLLLVPDVLPVTAAVAAAVPLPVDTFEVAMPAACAVPEAEVPAPPHADSAHNSALNTTPEVGNRILPVQIIEGFAA